MRYFIVTGHSLDEVTSRILKEYGGKAYIITFNKEVKTQILQRPWYSKAFLKPKTKEILVYKAYCSLPENNEEIEEVFVHKNENQITKNTNNQLEKKINQEDQKKSLLIEEPPPITLEVEEKKESLFKQELEDLKEMMSHFIQQKELIDEEEKLNYLMSKDFSYVFSKRLLESLQVPVDDLETFKIIIKEKLRLYIKQEKGIIFKEDTAYIFLGATGVGKTTTLAKIAALFFKQGLRHFDFISFDSYRLGAKEQLSRYAQVFEKSFSLIQNKKEFENSLSNVDKNNVIFLDTAGESLEKDVRLSEVKEYLPLMEKPLKTILVLSATSKVKDLFSIKNRFNDFNIDYVIITKVDETKSMGSILEFLYGLSLPVIYYTNGQDVPLDIKEMDLNIFFKYL